MGCSSTKPPPCLGPRAQLRTQPCPILGEPVPAPCATAQRDPETPGPGPGKVRGVPGADRSSPLRNQVTKRTYRAESSLLAPDCKLLSCREGPFFVP